MMNTTLRTITAVLCILVITICSVLIFNRVVGSARIADMTAEKVYTLSDGTNKILGKLSEPIKLKLYYSRVAARKGPEQIRFWNNYYLYVRDLLNEYVRLSNGKLVLEEIDPRPYSEEEEEALAFKIRRFQLSDEEAFFFGMAAVTELGKDKTIAFFEPNRQEFVEYDVSKLISDLVQRQKRKIGVITQLPVLGTDMNPYMMQMMQAQGRQAEEPWGIAAELKQTFDMEKVEVGDDAKIPADVDFLWLIHPKNLDEKTLFAVDQYVMNGGKLMVFADPHSMEDRPPETPGQNQMQAMMSHDSSSNLNNLLEKWGVTMPKSKISVDRTLAQKAQLSQFGQPATFYPWMRLKDDCFNKEQVMTAKLKNIQMMFAGQLKIDKKAGTEITPLLQTSSIGSTWEPKGAYELMMPNPDNIRKAVIDGTEPVVMACMIRGKMQTNYPEGIEVDDADAKPEEKKDGDDKEKKEEAKPKKKLEPIKEAAEGACVIVVADTDFLTDRLSYQRSFFGLAKVGDNSSFIVNALDYLGGSEDLIAVRTRGQVNRPFTLLEKIEAEADKATAEEQDALNDKIKKYQDELNKLGKGSAGQDIAVIQSEAIKKRRQLEKEVRVANKELRKLRARKREKTEALARSLKLQNTVVAPAILLLVAGALLIFRYVRSKKYATRREQ